MTEVVPPRPRVATFGGIAPGAAAPAPPAGPDFAAIHASPAFVALRGRFRRFVFGMTAVFFVWYLTYVLLAAYAKDFMATRVTGSVTVGLILGLLQFASTIAITACYLRWARSRIDPDVAAIRAAAQGVAR
ncbi:MULTISPECIES: DUF485 domain-containing protein [Actinokineospora]|uniref:DUF485 domain-containing protein n=1 Tax=Actinokineospora fastidiosa TaxID=1816 RepID=A0A918GJK9_9PSEU|nr:MULTISPECIES: DUF485 domain-containing protein [Actinokineospora]UVS80787.1 hypothetical protein Actkin_04539 [Actinokineospora sp. UTMC 2448]GGS37178.1 hypothetical protein GCM10010171_35050 [Actinokineospora fastidiosa]